MHWEHGILTTGPPGKISLVFNILDLGIEDVGLEDLGCRLLTLSRSQKIQAGRDFRDHLARRFLTRIAGELLKTKAAWALKESFGPRKENNSLKGPLLNHLTSEKTKHNFSSILMLQASYIYLGLITPCLETYHPLYLPRRLITPCPIASVISTKEYSKYPA